MNKPLIALMLGLVTANGALAAPATNSTAALEALLACKAGSDFTEAQVDQAFHAAGLTRDPGACSSRRTSRWPCSVEPWPARM